MLRLVRIIALVFAAGSMSGCMTTSREILSGTKMDIERMAVSYGKGVNLKDIAARFGPPDFLDFKANKVGYIATYDVTERDHLSGVLGGEAKEEFVETFYFVIDIEVPDKAPMPVRVFKTSVKTDVPRDANYDPFAPYYRYSRFRDIEENCFEITQKQREPDEIMRLLKGENEPEKATSDPALLKLRAAIEELKKKNPEQQNWSGVQIEDSVLKGGFNIKFLSCLRLRDISALQGQPIHTLRLSGTQVSDLRPLKGMPLMTLDVAGCSNIKDLSALKGMRLSMLSFEKTAVTDLTPLKGMPLEIVSLPKKVEDLTVLREMKTLRLINWTPVTDFWKGYKKPTTTPR